jgi:hypothetical protein
MMVKESFFAILACTVWVSVSEFFRNELLLKSYWIEHFETHGRRFPDSPLNGAIWALWSLLYSVFLFCLTRNTPFLRSTVLGWMAGFVLMWVVAGNLGVLPFTILPYAIPLSYVEVLGAVLILLRISPRILTNQ